MDKDKAKLDAIKAAILAKRLKQRVDAHAAETAASKIVPADRSRPLPLSSAQKRLWFLAQLDSAAMAAYNIPAALHLKGRLDRHALQWALDRVVARHEILRTSFVDAGEDPVQVIADENAGFHLEEREIPGADQTALARALADEAARPFDLSRGPLIRGLLLRLAADEHVLVVSQHHVVSDGWSIGILVKEVSALYAAHINGSPDTLAPLQVQYADYADWQNRWLAGTEPEKQADFWVGQLQDAPALLELPSDRPRPAAQSYAGADHKFTLPPQTSAGLRALSQRHGATLFMTMLAAWSALLSRLSGQGDIVVGTPVANRLHAEVEPLIGFFVNMLAIRVRLDNGISTPELLAQVKAGMLAAYAHQELPFEKVVESLQPLRTRSHSPVFQTMLSMNNTPANTLSLPGLVLSPLALPHESTHFDISLAADDDGERINCAIEYATDLFDASTIVRWSGYLVAMLEGMAADESQPLSRLNVMADAERKQVLEAFNATQHVYPTNALLHQLFEASARRTPEAVAVVFNGQSLSYDELNRRANRLAHRLIAMGVGHGGCVAVCAERSIDMIAGLLAVLKAGAAYVPLDPAYPVDRLALMLQDCAPAALITQAGLFDRLPPHAVARLCLDDTAHDALSDADPLVPALSLSSLAYVIYTSGSTGRPKGVMIEHGNVLNFIHWALKSFSTDVLASSVFSTSINFDLAVFELFAPLAAGTTIVLVENILATPAALAGSTLINTVPSALSALLDSGAVPSSVRMVNVAGEPLRQGLAERLFATTGVKQLANLYGPTETTTYSTWVTMERAGGFDSTIGRPVANTRIYILDAHGQPVPAGVPGELFIGGAGVARGYLNRPDLTAERFVADPFSSEPNARLYRTGDLGRWLPGGRIEYLGRNDFQVKIRGFRIELGEIETRLLACAGVREAAVLAREDVPGDKRLVAYLVPQAGASLSAAALRTELAASLAEYMLPAAFVMLATLPLTPNGKLDRKALPAPDASALTSHAYEAPAGETETAIAAIWQDLLGLDRIGRRDHFFELGGHSLLAVRLVSRLRDSMGVELPLRELFAQPVLSALASVITAGTQTKVAPIAASMRTGPLPLSWMQQRLWFLNQLDAAAGAAYHMPGALRLRGALSLPALQAALDAIVNRHESLRTSFTQQDGQPLQVIHAPAPFMLAQQDVSLLPDDVRAGAHDGALEQAIAAFIAAPFDLSAVPLVRGLLIRVADDEHVLAVNQHHIISDGWSIGILVRELGILYAAFLQGEANPLQRLPHLAIQYADFAVWQRQWLQGEALDAQVAFWRTHLQGAPALLALPTDRPRPAAQSFAGATVPVILSPALSRQLHVFSRKHDATLFMTLLAGWSILLSRLSGQDDVVVGTPVANRQRAEVEPLIGFFVNTLAVRTTLPAGATVSEVLAQVKATLLSAYAHQDLPFEQVVEAVQPLRSLSHSPIFQAMLSLNNTPGQELSLPALTVAVQPLPHGTTHFDVSLLLAEDGEGIAGVIEYATDLFDTATIERWASHLTVLLEAMTAEPSTEAAALPLLRDDERQTILERFNDTAIPYPSGRLAHQLFEEQANRIPDATALVFEDRLMSYGELNRHANQLAHRLLAMGVRPDDRVAICAERSPEMVVGLLAILKAGAAYVPLDSAYPAERLAFMLEDAAPVALITQSALEDVLPAHGVPVIVLDGAVDAVALVAHSASNPVVAGLGAAKLAYVIYTSGSTGRPKGVMIEHGGLMNYLQWAHDAYAASQTGSLTGSHGADAVVSSPIAFDATVTSLYLPLISGGKVRLVRDGDELAALERIAREPHTSGIVKITPAHLKALGQSLQSTRSVCSPQVFVIGGEALPAATALLWKGLCPEARLINEYGPTETVVGCIIHEVGNTSDLLGKADVPIGRPIANTQIYILDARQQPVPIGVAGEIYIGGAGVARGYLNRPELSTERFVADSFGGTPDSRLYRTGDLARWRTDGSIEYLGRNDFQVKIRGFRIELGEIEACLLGMSGVKEAAVLAREDAPGDKRLVAYLVPHDGIQLAPAELRQELALTLADYMVPAAFVLLDALPLTPNGKLDRTALPQPGQAAVTSRAYEAPQGEVEAAIAASWSELLGLDRVGRHDHFFELGGHSLMAVRLVSHLRQTLGIELPLRQLFAHPILAELAAAARNASRSDTPSIVAVPRTGNMPLSWMQQRLWFLEQLDAAAGAAYHMPGALRLRGSLSLAALQAALDAIMARHEILRTAFAQHGNQPVQVIGPPKPFDLAYQDLSALPLARGEDALQQAITSFVRKPFNLVAGPLIRGLLVCVGENDHVLAISQHHIISDGWSIGIFARELTALYDAFLRGESNPLPPLPIQYADFAWWQRNWLQGEILASQVAFWRAHLQGAPALLELPADRARPAVQSYAGATVPLLLSTRLSRRLREFSRTHEATLFMTLLAAWSMLLSRLSGQDDIVVGTPVANRQRAEVESLIGFFVNTLAVRVIIEEGATVAQVLGRVKSTLLSAYAHQDLPFEQVVEALQPTRSLSHSPVFQCMLSLNNIPADELVLPGLTLSPHPLHHATTRFDLSLSLTDDGDAISGAFEYATDLFDASTIERWAGHFTVLLDAMTADDQARVAALPLLASNERRLMLEGFNATSLDYSEDALIHQLFEASASRAPDAVAVVSGELSLSYRELNRRANRFARQLCAMGVVPGDRVAVSTERTADMVAGLLAILKAGAAYVPLDPAYPADRLAHMLEDCAPAALITQAALADRLPPHAVPSLCLDEARFVAATDAQDDANPVVSALSPSSLAYLIYTSGSTGRPKGVMIEHGNALNFIHWALASFSIDTLARSVFSTSINFHLAVFELFAPLAAGTTIVLVDNILSSPAALAGCTLINTVPSALAALLDDAAVPPSVRAINVAGEPLQQSVADRLFARTGVACLANLYGPTETTTYSTWVAMNRQGGFDASIGRPVANTQVYILDAQRQPVPLGVAGEIYIGGAGVARGYLNQPALSAERFLADPFSGAPNARMYKTGDLGRWRSDGRIDYRGRNDFQVKIRGFRIELGEIETGLLACQGVKAALVLAREDVPGDKRLVAYVVPQPDASLSPADLRTELSATLAEYMLPSAFVTLDAFPPTPNGKLDRRALPAPDHSAVTARDYAPPEGDVENAIAVIWQDLLGLARVGRHDHFFELGGHSLMVIELMARMREQGLHAEVRSVFGTSTLAALAATVKRDIHTHDHVAPANLLADAFEASQALDDEEEIRI